MDFSTIIQLLADLQTKINDLTQALADGDAFAKAQYDRGFADGVASVVPGDVQEQIDAAVAAAVGPLNEQIASLTQSINSLQEQISNIPGMVAEAVRAENERVIGVLREEKNKLAEKIMPALDEAAESLERKLRLP